MFWALLLQRGIIFYWHLALVLQRGSSFYWPLAKEKKCFWRCALLLQMRGIEGGVGYWCCAVLVQSRISVIVAAPSSCEGGATGEGFR